jgi:hypothetical protein
MPNRHQGFDSFCAHDLFVVVVIVVEQSHQKKEQVGVVCAGNRKEMLRPRAIPSQLVRLSRVAGPIRIYLNICAFLSTQSRPTMIVGNDSSTRGRAKCSHH